MTFSLGDPVTDLLLSSYVNLVLSIKNGWTTRQFEVMTMYAKLENQEKVAKLQGVSQPTISAIMRDCRPPPHTIRGRSCQSTLNTYSLLSQYIPLTCNVYGRKMKLDKLPLAGPWRW